MPMNYWIVGARIADGARAAPVDGVDIHVADGRIAELGTAPTDVERLDAGGLTVTPGLIDAHVHLGLSSDMTASLRHELSVAELAADIFANCQRTLDEGFTTVRDVGGIDGGLVRTVASGKVAGPRILASGPIQCQTGGHGHLGAAWEATQDWQRHDIPGLRSVSLLCDSPDQMRQNVRETFRRGADFLKLCVTGGVVSYSDALTDTQLSVAEIAVAVEEASARGTYVTVHAHNNAGIRNAVRAGVTCIEHGSMIDAQTAALMAEHGVAHVPTLLVVDVLDADVSSTGLPRTVTERIGSVAHGMRVGLREARAAGVRVGSGSDLIGPDQSHRGRELMLRSEVETPMLALQSATSINAQILGVADEVGTIEAGKQADLVAFSSDPLDDPRVFSDPSAVVLVVQRGHLVKDRR